MKGSTMPQLERLRALRLAAENLDPPADFRVLMSGLEHEIALLEATARSRRIPPHNDRGVLGYFYPVGWIVVQCSGIAWHTVTIPPRPVRTPDCWVELPEPPPMGER